MSDSERRDMHSLPGRGESPQITPEITDEITDADRARVEELIEALVGPAPERQ